MSHNRVSKNPTESTLSSWHCLDADTVTMRFSVSACTNERICTRVCMCVAVCVPGCNHACNQACIRCRSVVKIKDRTHQQAFASSEASVRPKLALSAPPVNPARRPGVDLSFLLLPENESECRDALPPTVAYTSEQADPVPCRHVVSGLGDMEGMHTPSSSSSSLSPSPSPSSSFLDVASSSTDESRGRPIRDRQPPAAWWVGSGADQTGTIQSSGEVFRQKSRNEVLLEQIERARSATMSECRVCLEDQYLVLLNGRKQACGHTLCKKCCRNLITSMTDEHRPVKCPMCKQGILSFSSLFLN